MSVLCPFCEVPIIPIGADPFPHQICEQCCDNIAHFIQPALNRFKRDYKGTISNIGILHPTCELLFEIKYSGLNTFYLMKKFIEYLGFDRSNPITTEEFQIKLNYDPDKSPELIEPLYRNTDNHMTYSVEVSFEVKYHVPRLAHVAAKRCAKLGLTEGLTADAIDQVLNHDYLISIRYLF
ncbi:Hypothetical protein FSTVST1_197 [Faustovirus ST1]|nr:Hypothetical protein FSTVST1_197 [Faustovirus ST1]